ncbi:hypothetical protein [Pseudomonas mohnii]|uniref:hypothetical protein n=1 Tax=Pseudomonas mohnii TaxID=395600 RepID=UPI0018DBAC53|nr:hypothetical protein [Pseudomonas mohnii]MBH8611599.1 hypothetical protein [Pseudomonas mohnii]
MNINELEKKHNARKITGHVSAMMRMSLADFPFKSYFLHGNINDELRYIQASSENSEYILFFIPKSWGLGEHDLTAGSNIIRFEPGMGLPNDPEWWYAQRGKLFITDISETSFSGNFSCYRHTDNDRPALMGGTFNVNFNEMKE